MVMNGDECWAIELVPRIMGHDEVNSRDEHDLPFEDLSNYQPVAVV